MDNNKLIVFEDKKIRRTWSNDDWYYVIEDVIYALTESNDPKQYIQKLKSRDEFLKQGWVQFVHTLGKRFLWLSSCWHISFVD